MKAPITWETEPTSMDHPFFYGFSQKHRAIMETSAQPMDFEPGVVLFRQGEPANRFYLIHSGNIAVESQDQHGHGSIIQTLSIGDVLGWSWLFQPFVWHFGARALEQSATTVLDAGRLLSIAERDHDFGYELMKRVSQLVVQRLQATRSKLII